MSKPEVLKEKCEKTISVKLTCDNSAFLQSLDEVGKKIDELQEKLNQLKK